jgi:hypothetical protein
VDKPVDEDFQIFEKHKKERFGQFHKFYCDRNGYCQCEVCKRVKEYFREENIKLSGE